ncbi:hypothetical protein K438DRAFT_2031481, partial [Mycena galopus ATCC 62051]
MTGVFKALHEASHGDYLFPNLEHLFWQYFDDGYSPYIDPFLAPRLKTIQIREEGDGRCPGLTTLRQKHTGLISVVIEEVNGDCENAHSNELYDFVRTLLRVEVLDVRILDTETLKHLGHLPTLKTLHTMLYNSVAFPGVTNSSMFSTLRDVQ